jgi:hypothetical protein
MLLLVNVNYYYIDCSLIVDLLLLMRTDDDRRFVIDCMYCTQFSLPAPISRLDRLYCALSIVQVQTTLQRRMAAQRRALSQSGAYRNGKTTTDRIGASHNQV